MKKIVLIAGALLVSTTCWAHLPEGLVRPAVHFPSGHLPIIDSDLSDWDVVTDPYLITHEDLTETVTGLGTQRDAADLALRAYVGWSPETNKVYIMEDRWDDAVWVGDHSWENAKGSGCSANARDFLEIQIDGDHSGGQFNSWNDESLTQEEKDILHGQQAQGLRSAPERTLRLAQDLRARLATVWRRGLYLYQRPRGARQFLCRVHVHPVERSALDRRAEQRPAHSQRK